MKNLLRRCADAMTHALSTKANYWAEFGVDAALTVALIFFGWQYHTGGVLFAIFAILLGFLVFSFVEYFFHRWMFHTRIPLFERGHRKHHENPKDYDSLPFFLPGVIAVSLTALFALILPLGFALMMGGAATFGYILYGLSHFAIHHVRFRQPLLMRWAAAHHIHHHHPKTNFGVTSPLWDYLLGTRYVRRSAPKS